MTRTERLLQLAMEMVRLENELAFLRAEFARLAGDATPAPAAMTLKGAPRVPRRHAPIAALAKTYLDEQAPAGLRVPAVATAIGATKESTAAALSKLVYSGKARRVGVGVYASALATPPESTGSDSRSVPRDAG